MTIHYPEPSFRTKKQGGKDFLIDNIRKRWLLLTPEEWVRQNFIQYLVQVKKYPASLIAIEKEISLGELRKRFDILIYRDAKPWMIIECKEMNVPLSEATIRQILNYNITIQADYIVITNGTDNHGFSLITGKAEAVLELPDF